jgi:glutaredoxin
MNKQNIILLFDDDKSLLEEIKFMFEDINIIEYQDFESKIKNLTDVSLDKIPYLQFENSNYYFINLLDDYKYIKYKKILNNTKLEYDIFIYDKDFKSNNNISNLTRKFFYELDISKKSYTMPYLYIKSEYFKKKYENGWINYLWNFLL